MIFAKKKIQTFLQRSLIYFKDITLPASERNMKKQEILKEKKYLQKKNDNYNFEAIGTRTKEYNVSIMYNNN